MSEEELMLQAQNEEQAQAEQAALAAQQAFMSQYGSRFSGDEPIGLAILNNLNERGIDVSAADTAVQEIINKLREESNHILEVTQEYVNQLNMQAQEQQAMIKQLDADAAQANLALAEKLNAVDQAVAGAVDPMGDQAVAQQLAAAQAEPVIPADTGMPPEGPPIEQAPAPEEQAAAPAPEEQAPAPEEQAAAAPAPEEQAPPAPGPTSPFNPMNQQPQQEGAIVSSDERLKTIKAALHNARAKRNARSAQPQGMHLATNIIDACGR